MLTILVAIPLGGALVRLIDTDVFRINLMKKVLELMDVRFITTQMTLNWSFLLQFPILLLLWVIHTLL
jgi:hypothetical protein